MKSINYLTLLLATALAACTNQLEPDNSPNLRTLSNSEVSVSNAGNDFAFSLYRNVQGGSSENVFISPLSVGMALGMTLNGAAGETRDGILETINYSGLQPTEVNQAYHDLTTLLTTMDRKIELSIANSVWYKNIYTVSPDFSGVVSKYYDGKAEGLDFAKPEARDVINSWVEGKTNHKIKNLVESISPDDAMFLINAVYFKGSWANQFDKNLTRPADFVKEDGSTIQVPMMYSKGVKLSYTFNPRLDMIDFAYGNGQFTMTILLPRNPYKVSDIVDSINSDSLVRWSAQATDMTPILEMPKFKMEWTGTLNGPLTTMGMGIAFSDQASFPGLFEDALPLQISKVIHKSFVEVSEEGTEAAAATSVSMVVTSAGPPHTDHVLINRPFLFLIREKHSGVILFIGQVHNPVD